MRMRNFRLCPTCKKPAGWKDNPHRPFCSERCRLLDLGAWIEGRYQLPGEPVSHEQGNGQDAKAVEQDDRN